MGQPTPHILYPQMTPQTHKFVMLLLLLLFGRSQVCAVWQNYDVVVLQPRSGTDPKLGSVTKVTSKLNPAPYLSTIFWIFSFLSPSMSLLPPHPPPLDWHTPLFCSLLSPFSSSLGSPAHLDNLPLPPASAARPCAFCLATLDQIPSVTLFPWSPAQCARFWHLPPCPFDPL